jgi:hypothetical protein
MRMLRALADRREREPSATLGVVLVIVNVCFATLIWAALTSPPPAPWRPAPASVAAARDLTVHPQAPQTMIEAPAPRPPARAPHPRHLAASRRPR